MWKTRFLFTDATTFSPQAIWGKILLFHREFEEKKKSIF